MVKELGYSHHSHEIGRIRRMQRKLFLLMLLIRTKEKLSNKKNNIAQRMSEYTTNVIDVSKNLDDTVN